MAGSIIPPPDQVDDQVTTTTVQTGKEYLIFQYLIQWHIPPKPHHNRKLNEISIIK